MSVFSCDTEEVTLDMLINMSGLPVVHKRRTKFEEYKCRSFKCSNKTVIFRVCICL